MSSRRGRRENRRQVGRLAEQVHRDDRLGARRDRGDGRGRVEVEGVGVDVDEHRRRAQPGHRAGGREERIGRRDDLVARADVERHQRRQQRVGARRHADRVRRLQVGGQLALEALDFRAADEALAVADARDRVEQGLPERGVLCVEVEQRDGHKHPMVHGRPGRRSRRLDAARPAMGECRHGRCRCGGHRRRRHGLASALALADARRLGVPARTRSASRAAPPARTTAA